jgi:hypothetical protein
MKKEEGGVYLALRTSISLCLMGVAEVFSGYDFL